MKKKSKEESFFVAPSENVKNVICGRLNLSEQDIEDKTRVLRKWVFRQPHLPQGIAEKDVKPFIAWAQGDLELAKKRLDAFYSLRSYQPDLFGPRDPLGDDFKNSYTCSTVVMLPRLTADGRMVLVGGPSSPDPGPFTAEGLVRRVTLVVETALRAQPLCAGMSIILDQKYTNISHMTKICPSTVKACLYGIQDVIPVRLKEVVIINLNSVARLLLNSLVLPLLKKKIRERIFLYTDGCEVLSKHYSKEILPSDYGGEEKTLKELNDEIKNYLISNRDSILVENLFMTNESLREGKGPFTHTNNCSVM